MPSPIPSTTSGVVVMVKKVLKAMKKRAVARRGALPKGKKAKKGSLSKGNLKKLGQETVAERMKRCKLCQIAMTPFQARFGRRQWHYERGCAERAKENLCNTRPEVNIIFLIIANNN